ncbi:MAG: isoleucine--tRNA ligase [Armatimonadota bacterium]
MSEERMETGGKAFAARGDLPRREEAMLRRWETLGLYQRALQRCEGRPRFILHDGPPFSVAGIGFDHLLNKLLKDFIIKFRTMQGYQAPFVPGWETHALATEITALRTFAVPRHAIPPLALRKRCASIARQSCTLQRKQLQRLGIRADWQFPYLTLYPEYEAAVLRAFGELAANGLIYRADKPVHWCPTCRAALADAETELQELPVHIALIAFPVARMPHGLFPEIKRKRLSFAVRTEQPWTLPGTVAVAAHPEAEYALVRDAEDKEGFAYLVSAEGVEDFARLAALAQPEVLMRVAGRELAEVTLLHPLSRRELPLLVDAAVQPVAGTGLWGIAPDHDAAAFSLAARHGLAPMHLLEGDGIFSKRARKPAAGQPVEKVHVPLLALLDEEGVLLGYKSSVQQAPHCWRCQQPVITRAIPHWFISVERLAERATAAGGAVQWAPAWGGARMAEMIGSRPDWCLSRSRVWGVPIPAFSCARCSAPLLSPAAINHVAEIVQAQGSDAWYRKAAGELLPEDTACPACGSSEFHKIEETFDVWFASACSQFAVLERREDQARPADLVVERHDQFRGWLQGALLAGLGAGREEPPYRAVLAHGFVLDRLARRRTRDGEIAREPMDLVAKYGADILRLWAASVDAHNEIVISDAALEGAVHGYRRLRTTAQFLLQRLDHLTVDKLLPVEGLPELDRWVLDRLARLVERVTAAAEGYAFHRAMRAIREFCARDLSVYLSAIEPRFSTLHASRRAAQTVLYCTAETLARLLAPMLSFLAEDIWEHLPADERPTSPQLAEWPAAPAAWRDDALAARWELALAVRHRVFQALAAARIPAGKNTPNKSKVILYSAGENQGLLESLGDNLVAILPVRAVELAPRAQAPADAQYRDEELAVRVIRPQEESYRRAA